VNHISYEKWLQYVADELGETTREAYESHLYGCDICLERYQQALHVYEDQLPMIPEETRFVSQVMSTISTKKQPAVRTVVSSNKRLFHYLVAAVMTLAFMSSGLFAQLAQVPNDFEKSAESRQSMTERIMEKTLSWIPVDQNKAKEGNEK